MNRICQLLQIDVPIIQGGMGNISNAPLTAAVSGAGGLGTMGTGTRTPDEVEKLILEVKKKTNKPFAVNIPIAVSAYSKELAQLLVKYHIPVVSLSAGNPSPFIPFFHEHGIKVMVVVGTVKHAVKAEEAGADIIVGEGYEAAGINSPFETTTFTLIPQLVDAVKIPVVAAGGIGDGRGLAAALALGAEGVQVGTRWIVAKEAPFAKEYKQKILAADDTSTVVVGRSVGQVRRVLKGEYVKEILENESQGLLSEKYAQFTDESAHVKGALEGKDSEGFMNGGQIAGLIKSEQTVAEIIEEFMTDAKKIMERLARKF